MIVIEENPDAKTPTSSRTPILSGDGYSQYLPPPYTPRSPYGSNSSILQYPDDVPLRRERLPRGENAKKRFFMAFSIAIGLWVLFAILVGKISIDIVGLVQNEPITSSVCVEGGKHELSSETRSRGSFASKFSFKVPPSTKELYFFSNDSSASGNLIFDTVPNGSSTMDIYVDVEIIYQFKDAVHHSKVCYSTDDKLGHYFDFLSSEYLEKSNILKYNVLVHLPPGTEDMPRIFNKLRAEMPLYRVVLQHMESLRFKEVVIKTENSPISCTYLDADDLTVKTKNSPIEGYYSASSKLELTTENSPIKVRVNMLNTGNSPPTDVKIRTDNARIDVLFDLFSSKSIQLSRSSLTSPTVSSDNIGGRFAIDVQTRNAPLGIEVVEQPISSSLQLHAQTSNGPAHVSLPSTYEGGFSVKSTMLRPRVELSDHSEDPADTNRHRKFEIHLETGTAVEGSISWVDKRGRGGSSKGYAYVETSLLSAVLVL